MPTRTTSNVTQRGTSENLFMRKNITLPFGEINEPGVYYSHQTGWLYRVPGESLLPGHSPVINIVSFEENYVTKISDDPWLPAGKAREICANMDFTVNF